MNEGQKRFFSGGRRVAMCSNDSENDWYVGYSPRNSIEAPGCPNVNGASVEGTWEDWVKLAKEIVAEDERRALHT